MPFGFVSRVSMAQPLKAGLDTSVARTRAIADRVARATVPNQDGFQVPEAGALPGSPAEGPIDLETEMVSLADETLRFEATTRLLQKAYQQVRSSLRDR